MSIDVIDEMKVTVRNISEHKECIISPVDAEQITNLRSAQVQNWIGNHGVVILRGFNVNEESFSEFIHSVSKRVTVDPARTFVSKNAQLVDSGAEPIGLHCENGNAPRLPNTLWFFCKTAAKKGSRTTYCDGERVWRALPEWVRESFLSQRIMYQRSLPEHLWKRYVFHEVGGFQSVEDITFGDLQKLAEAVEGQTFELLPSGAVFSKFRCAAAHPSKYSNNMAFANSLLGPSHNYEPPVISFEDGSSIEDETWNIIRGITELCTEEIPWQDGDVAIIDNTRYMHGRRAIEDTNRKICAALSYI
jgi:alpha-ketoglutarate-dependent taurine dioxygenase